MNPFAHAGISVAATVDAAEKGDYKRAGEHGYRAAVALAGIAAAAIGVGSRVGRPVATFPRETLRGVSLKWLDRNLPRGWTKVATEKNQGWIWRDPNGIERLRYMRPTGKNPAANQWSRQSNGYFRWLNAKGEDLDIDGNVVPRGEGHAEATHIMYEGPL